MEKELKEINKKFTDVELVIKKNEDDFKNIINEKDKIINSMNNKLIYQENVLNRNKSEIKELKKNLELLTKEFTNFRENMTRHIFINHKNDSSIIKIEELSLIENAFKNKFKKIVKSYELLFRASHDGYDSKDFHRICNGKKNTLILILTDSGRRFGGFTDLEWDQNNTYKKGGNSFIFSLDNNEIYYKKEDDVYEIGGFSSYGPDFYDFHLGVKCNVGNNEESNFFMSFDAFRSRYFNNDFLLTEKREFLVKDYEVYILNLEDIKKEEETTKF